MRKPLEKELKSYREQGISLYLNGILSNPKTIAKACQIAEGGGYMRDYVEDEKGRIARVDFALSILLVLEQMKLLFMAFVQLV